MPSKQRGRRLPKEIRKTNNVLLRLNDDERDALEAEAERLDVEHQTYLRVLILAVHKGELTIPRGLFQR